jgi:hypothetical protein
VPILPFYGDVMDSELKLLEKFLRKIHTAEDYQPILEKNFQMQKFILAQNYNQISEFYLVTD